MLEEGKIRVDLPSLEIKMSMKWELVVGCASHRGEEWKSEGEEKEKEEEGNEVEAHEN